MIFIKKSEEIRLYRGTYLRIDGAGTMRFETDSAKDGYELTANPLKENVAVKGTMTAGKDFPAGSYDIVCKKKPGHCADRLSDHKRRAQSTRQIII